MSDSGEVNVGAIVRLAAPEEGDNVWRAEQISVAQNLPPRDELGRIPIEWSFGPVKTVGYVDTNTFEIGVSTTIVGVNVGTIYGNLKDSVGLNIRLSAAKGSIKWYLKNGNELWASPDISTSTSEAFSRDCKIITF